MLGRVAFSPNIRDRLDYSCALFDPAGRLLGQATHLPVHLGSMAYAMRDLVRGFAWEAGDMVILNDPFQGGTHLPDVTFVAPVFVDSELAGFCANRAHHADIGAEAPGSMPISSDISEEGILISPVKIMRRGTMDQALLDGLLDQLNDPASSLGDFNAQIAANRLGERRLAALAGQLGVSELLDLGEQLQDYAQRLASASMAELPRGRYTFRDFLDDDGYGTHDIPIQVTLEIGERDIIIDFAGTSAQVPGNLNCPLSVTAAAVFYVFRCLMPPQIPPCDGAMRHFQLRAPAGSTLSRAAPRRAVAAAVSASKTNSFIRAPIRLALRGHIQ